MNDNSNLISQTLISSAQQKADAIHFKLIETKDFPARWKLVGKDGFSKSFNTIVAAIKATQQAGGILDGIETFDNPFIA